MTTAWQSKMPLAVLGTGVALPGDAVSTEALVAHMVDRFGFAAPRRAFVVADRMGIHSRHLVRDFHAAHEEPRAGDSNPALCARAIASALAQAGVDIDDVGLLIGHTSTPASQLPGNIAWVADALGYTGPHMELRQACTGFASALMIATGLIAANPGRPVVIVGSETGTTYFDPASLNHDSGQLVNFVQMGDGAGAIVLGSAAAGSATIQAAWYGAVGVGRAPGISLQPAAREFVHDFSAIRASGHVLFEAGRDAAAALGHALSEADRFIPHQVSGRIGALVAQHFGLPVERAFVNADRVGNTGSAAIWIALDALRQQATPGENALVLGAEASKFMFGGFAYHHQ